MSKRATGGYRRTQPTFFSLSFSIHFLLYLIKNERVLSRRLTLNQGQQIQYISSPIARGIVHIDWKSDYNGSVVS